MVKRESFAAVVGHDRFKVNNLLDEEYKARDPSIIVKEACKMVGQKLKYNLATNNCEHFATEMRIRRGRVSAGVYLTVGFVNLVNSSTAKLVGRCCVF